MSKKKPSNLGVGIFVQSFNFGEGIEGGGGYKIETTMRIYPDLDLGMVVMSSVNGYQTDRIAEGLVRAWENEK